MHTKILLTIITLLLISLVGFFALNSYIYNTKQESNEIPEPYRATLNGEYVCLPHVDQTGPQTDECAHGIKTDAGEYYVVDLNLMSQAPIVLEIGQHFTANGVLTPIEHLSTDHWRQYPVLGIFSITDSVVIDTDEIPQVCDADALICPDGSSVGRSGPNCEFNACPSEHATSTRTTTYLGGTTTALNLSISPRKVVSDSRCPIDVTCIWAGTVEVHTTLATQVANGEHVLALNEPKIFGGYTITLVDVTPAKTQGALPESSYRFTFEISRQ